LFSLPLFTVFHVDGVAVVDVDDERSVCSSFQLAGSVVSHAWCEHVEGVLGGWLERGVQTIWRGHHHWMEPNAHRRITKPMEKMRMEQRNRRLEQVHSWAWNVVEYVAAEVEKRKFDGLSGHVSVAYVFEHMGIVLVDVEYANVAAVGSRTVAVLVPWLIVVVEVEPPSGQVERSRQLHAATKHNEMGSYAQHSHQQP